MANAVWRVTITQKLGVITSGMWVEILSHHRPMQHQIIEALKQKIWYRMVRNNPHWGNEYSEVVVN